LISIFFTNNNTFLQAILLINRRKLQEKTEIKHFYYSHSLGGATSSLKTGNRFNQRYDIITSLARWLLDDNQARRHTNVIWPY